MLTQARWDEASGLYFPTTARADTHPCELRTYHAPMPVVTEGHHVHPVFLQNRLYGRIVDNELKYLCGTDHDSVHAWLYWLLGERAQPVDPGRLAKEEAASTFEWYLDNGGIVV